MPNYKIVCDEVQLSVVASACELYARLMMGQFNTILFNVLSHLDIPTDRYHEIQRLLDDAGKKVWNSGGGHPGIRHDDMPDASRVAWDAYCVIRQLLAFQRNPDGGFGVDFDPPMRSSKQPLMEVTPTDAAADPRPCKERLRDELAELLNVPPDDFQTAIDKIRQWRDCREGGGI